MGYVGGGGKFISEAVETGGAKWLLPPASDMGGDDPEEGHWNEFPDNNMSLMRVSMGVLPTSRTKKSCSITCDDTVRRLGSLNRSLPKRVG